MLKEIQDWKRKKLLSIDYACIYWDKFDYSILNNIIYLNRPVKKENKSVNECFIMADTETSKSKENTTYKAPDGSLKYNPVDNYLVAFTISIRAFEKNIVTLWGNNPRDLAECINKIISNLKGYETIIYWHNMSYDWVFIRKFMFEKFGYPAEQLNTKSHYPILIKWENGLTFKDSLILAQRSLEKWADDLNIEHKKAVGKWDYDKIRHQGEAFNADEIEYIEHDTLAGVECLDKLRIALNKNVYSMPYTATGIPREELRKIGKDNNARSKYKAMALTFEQYIMAEKVFHGGYTHSNRHLIDVLIEILTQCRDFSSSYPFVVLSEKFPMEKFTPLGNKDYEYILRNAENYAFMFKLILVKPRLKDDFVTMPSLQFSKCVSTINAITDNGRILCAEYVEIYLNEVDLGVIINQYEFTEHICTEVQVAKKEYLPRWFTDYVFSLYEKKTKLKSGDPVAYNLAKASLNASCYGMLAMKNIKETIEEDYQTGEYEQLEQDLEGLYDKFVDKRTTIFPYQWGVWVTTYAFRNLFELGKCCSTWIYSDTDSCYGNNWDEKKLEAYNKQCKEKIKANGYGCVLHNGREYWLGIAELDGEYSQFKTMGAKRYCGRSTKDDELHITVAGVPKKKGAKCLKDDINNFKKGFIFDGLTTGKLTHTYLYREKIEEINGDLYGDSIDLTPCDYKLDSVGTVDWEALLTEEIEVISYEET